MNRELLEPLGELCVALPGVPVLFAFLLAVPFQARFVSALASVLLIAPSALHRLNFRTPDKRRIVFLSNTLTVWGLLVLALAMTGVMLLISDVLFSRVAAVLIAGSRGRTTDPIRGGFRMNAALSRRLSSPHAAHPRSRLSFSHP